jgi:hypothetical protein
VVGREGEGGVVVRSAEDDEAESNGVDDREVVPLKLKARAVATVPLANVVVASDDIGDNSNILTVTWSRHPPRTLRSQKRGIPPCYN